MSDVTRQVQDGLRRMMGDNNPAAIFPATVTAVDEDNASVDVEDAAGVELFDVRLKAAIDGQDVGIMIYPAVGSSVLVGNIDKSASGFCVVGVAEVDKVRLRIGAVEIEAEAAGIAVKCGVEDMKEWLNDFLDGIVALTVTTAVGPSGTPINAATFITLKTRLDSLFK